MIIKLIQEFLGIVVTFDVKTKEATVIDILSPLSQLHEIGDKIINIQHLIDDYVPYSSQDRIYWEIYLNSYEQEIGESRGCDYCLESETIIHEENTGSYLYVKGKELILDVSAIYEKTSKEINYCTNCGNKLLEIIKEG